MPGEVEDEYAIRMRVILNQLAQGFELFLKGFLRRFSSDQLLDLEAQAGEQLSDFAGVLFGIGEGLKNIIPGHLMLILIDADDEGEATGLGIRIDPYRSQEGC